MKAIRIILGMLLFGFAAYMTLFHAVPRLCSEWIHAAEFVPAKSAKLVEAKCKNWNLFLFNNCVVKGETKSGEKFEIEDWRFGRAPSGSVQLLERATVPPTYTTDVSLATLNERLYLLICATFLSLVFIIAVLASIVKAMRPRRLTMQRS